jgi:ComF family protein
MFQTVSRLASDMLNLLFPELCNACGNYLYHGEKEICTKCLFDLPYTDFHLFHQNRVAQQFWGRLPITAAMALLYFKKGTKVQQLLHQLKYNDRTEVGVKLGNLLGEKLKQSAYYNNVDLIIPVPLHPKKQKQRGYNQSQFIAEGLASVLEIPTSADNLVRDKMTESQTKKARYTRYENMQEVFSVSKPNDLNGKNVLLIDDVITTGATL